MSEMTVKELKKALRGVPDDAIVILQDHDHSDDEWNGSASNAGHSMPGDNLYDRYHDEHGGYADIFWLHV